VTTGDEAALLAEQLAYYEARAPEYDHWFYREARYDRGPESTTQWNSELDEARATLGAASWAGRHVIELAPGTGIWTQWLLDQGARVSVVDGSTAMVEQMRARLGVRAGDVNVEVADLFQWRPTAQFDGLFLGFFLSHVPRARLDEFWLTIASALAPGGVVGLIDSRRAEESTARDHALPDVRSEVSDRTLDDGRAFRVVKNYFEPAEHTCAARAANITLVAHDTPRFFVVGTGLLS
jgi:SAM-dependent methyltransferase